MPTVKISALPSATAPLTGAEVIPLVQSGVTRKAPVPIYIGYVTPEQFGAVGDGVTNDAPAIQSAHDYLDALGGGVVVFANKTYKITAQLNWHRAVCLRGASQSGTVIKATTAIKMLVWAGGTAGNGIAAMTDISFDGGSAATVGVLLGNTDNNGFYLRGVYIKNCVDGLVMCTSFRCLIEEVTVIGCTHAQLWLAGSCWNNKFIRLTLDTPSGATVNQLLSRIDNGMYAAVGSPAVAWPVVNFANVFATPLIRGGTPVNLVRLEDTSDGGRNVFADAVMSEGSSGNPQVLIGASAIFTKFIGGSIDKGATGASFAFSNTAQAFQVRGMAASGWSGITWISNSGSGTVIGDSNISPGNLSEETNSVQHFDQSIDGSLARTLSRYYHFIENGSDGVNSNVPVFKAEGTIVPRNDNAVSLGNSARRWSDLRIVNATISGNVLSFGTIDTVNSITNSLVGNFVTITGNYTVTSDDMFILINTSAGATITMPTPGSIPQGRVLFLVNISAHLIQTSANHRRADGTTGTTLFTGSVAGENCIFVNEGTIWQRFS